MVNNTGKIACSIQKYCISHWLVGLPDPHPFCLRIYNGERKSGKRHKMQFKLLLLF